MASRVAAYRDYLRREGGEDWQKLSDNELDDLIASAMRAAENDRNELQSIKTISFWATIILICVIFLYLSLSYEIELNASLFVGLWAGSMIAGFLLSRIIFKWRLASLARKWEASGWNISKLIV